MRRLALQTMVVSAFAGCFGSLQKPHMSFLDCCWRLMGNLYQYTMCKRSINWLLVRWLTTRFGLSVGHLLALRPSLRKACVCSLTRVHWVFRIVGLGRGNAQEGFAES
jgi:hypothetical protein